MITYDIIFTFDMIFITVGLKNAKQEVSLYCLSKIFVLQTQNLVGVFDHTLKITCALLLHH